MESGGTFVPEETRGEEQKEGKTREKGLGGLGHRGSPRRESFTVFHYCLG